MKFLENRTVEGEKQVLAAKSELITCLRKYIYPYLRRIFIVLSPLVVAIVNYNSRRIIGACSTSKFIGVLRKNQCNGQQLSKRSHRCFPIVGGARPLIEISTGHFKMPQFTFDFFGLPFPFLTPFDAGFLCRHLEYLVQTGPFILE